MGWLDLAVIAVLLVSIAIGIVRGLVFELMSLAGWVVAYFVAHAFSAEVAALLPIGEPGSRVNLLAGFVLAFVGALLVWAVLSRVVRLVLRATPLSGVDRLLGGLFGGVRGAVALLVLFTGASMTPLVATPTWRASVTVPWLAAAAAGLKPLLPSPISTYLPA